MAEIDLTRAYWLDGPGRPHRAEGSTGSISWADVKREARYRTLPPKRCKAAGVPYGTPADDPRCVPHDAHREQTSASPPPQSERSPTTPTDRAAVGEGAAEPGGGARDRGPDESRQAPAGGGGAPAGRRVRYEPRALPASLPRAPDLPPIDAQPVDDDEGDELEGDEGFAEVDDGPPSGTSGDAGGDPEHHPDCPHATATFLCTACGKRYAHVSDEEASEAAEAFLVNVSAGIVKGRAAAAGMDLEQLQALKLHIEPEPWQIENTKRVLKPLLMRMGGASGFARLVINALALGSAVMGTAASAHPAGKCPTCREHAPAPVEDAAE